MNNGSHIPEEDLALFAMHALSEDETAVLREHLAACPECRDELAGLNADLVLMSASVEQHAIPEGARERFLARISNTTDTASAAARPAPVAVAPPARTATVRGEEPARRGFSIFGTLGWVAAAAALGFAAWIGNQDHQLHQQLDASRYTIAQLSAKADRAQELMEVLNSRSAQRVTLTESKHPPQPVAHATYLPSRGALIFAANNLRPLPAGKAYELWLIPENGTAPIPAGVFQVDASGSGSVVLPNLPVGVQAKAFGVTIEKAEGSAAPTLPIILSGQ